MGGLFAKVDMVYSGVICYNEDAIDRIDLPINEKEDFDMCSIGEKIAKLRKDNNMTQEELAGMIGVSSQSVSKWETGVTMPDIMLLPIIAGVFEITLDELFSVEKNPKKTYAPIEETPLAVYDAVLDTMWAWDDAQTARTKNNLSNNPKCHSGFVSAECKGVYADKNIALTYIAGSAASEALLENENAADFLKFLANPNVRKILKYQLENRGISYTLPSVSVKCGIKEEDAGVALEGLVKYSLSRRQEVEMDVGEKINIYGSFGDHKLPLLIYPLLSLAGQLSDFKESWYGFRG